MKRSDLLGERARGVLAVLALNLAAYSLISAIRGKDAFTNDPVPRFDAVLITAAAVVCIALAAYMLFGPSTRERR